MFKGNCACISYGRQTQFVNGKKACASPSSLLALSSPEPMDGASVSLLLPLSLWSLFGSATASATGTKIGSKFGAMAAWSGR